MKCYKAQTCSMETPATVHDVSSLGTFIFSTISSKQSCLPAKKKSAFTECKSWICNTVFRVVYCKPVSGQWHLWCDWGVEKLLFWQFVKTKPLFLHLRRPKCHQWFNFAIKHGWDFPELNENLWKFPPENYRTKWRSWWRIIYIWGIFQHMFTLEGTCCLCHSHLGSLHRWLAILGLDSLRESWDKTIHFYFRLHSEAIRHFSTSAQMCRAVSAFLHRFWCWSIQHSGSTEQLQDLWLTLGNAGDPLKSGSPAHWNKGDGWFLIKHQKKSS